MVGVFLVLNSSRKYARLPGDIFQNLMPIKEVNYRCLLECLIFIMLLVHKYFLEISIIHR